MSARSVARSRVRFIGTEEKARAKYSKLHKAMRQGGVELLDGESKTVLRDWAPRLGTRW